MKQITEIKLAHNLGADLQADSKLLAEKPAATPVTLVPLAAHDELIAALDSDVSRLQERILAFTDKFDALTDRIRTLELAADPDVVKLVAELRPVMRALESQRDDCMKKNGQLKEVLVQLKRQLAARHS